MTKSRSSPGKAAAPPPQPGTAAPDRTREEEVQRQLDEALADSFPASDPVSIVTSHQEDWDQPESK